MCGDVRDSLIALIRDRSAWMDLADRQRLTTINYAIEAVALVDEFSKKLQEWELLEVFFRDLEMQDTCTLAQKVVKGLDKLNVQYSIDSGVWEDSS